MKIFLYSTFVLVLFFAANVTPAQSKECKDGAGTERCNRYKKLYTTIGMRLCDTSMKHRCELTCKLCRPRASCEISKYGCCWDRRTPARGPGNEGCPYCRDKNPSLCKNVISRLLATGRVSRKQACSYGWSTRNCPKTCGMCALPAMAYSRCADSLFGCCWNYKPAYGINGEGCDECEDTYPHTCGQFNYYCNKQGLNEHFMRLHCPLTCGQCIKGQLLLNAHGKKHKV